MVFAPSSLILTNNYLPLSEALYAISNREINLQLSLDPSLLFAHKTSDGYSWTLVSRLGFMLRMAEEMYGPRDKDYTILGIEFVGDNPRLWYPGNCKHVAVQLGEKAMNNLDQACYQLAHECVHLLCPTGGAGANYLEEGLATYNSAHYMKTQMAQPNWRATLPSYIRAEALVRKIMEADSGSIKRMRQTEFNISAISADLLLSETSAITKEEADFLVSGFVRQ